MQRLLALSLSIISFFFSTLLLADQTITMYRVNNESNEKQSIGTITLSSDQCGVLITPALHGLPPGVHGFHIHEKPACDEKGMAAGAHLDPHKTNQHKGPYQHGHLGDLPILVVDDNGGATHPMLAPHLTLKHFKQHALIIHANGDNYADVPEKLGGGGDRIACGVIS